MLTSTQRNEILRAAKRLATVRLTQQRRLDRGEISKRAFNEIMGRHEDSLANCLKECGDVPVPVVQNAQSQVATDHAAHEGDRPRAV